MAIAGAGYYFFYQQPTVDQEEASAEEKCGVLTNIFIDGVFQKAENNFIYIQPKDKEDSIETIKLTDETTFLEVSLSIEMELTGQENISLTDFKEGDQVSVVALYDESKPEEKTALTVRHMVVK